MGTGAHGVLTRRDHLVGKLQEKYGHTKEAVNKQIDAWSKAIDGFTRAT